MAHQDFEKYAVQRKMCRDVSDRYDSFFKGNVLPLLKKDSKVLDYGCGDGTYFCFFKQFIEQNDIFGIDISKTRVMRCHELGWENVLKVNSLEPLPFPDAHFDLINLDQVIEHIKTGDISFYLQELKRVLKEGGYVIVITPNYPIKRFYDLFNAIRRRDYKRIKDDPTHVTKYSFSKLNDLLSKYFRILKLEPTGGFVWKKYRYNFFSHKIIGLLQKKFKDDYGHR
jgi:SAM-dependent methyltransferase